MKTTSAAVSMVIAMMTIGLTHASGQVNPITVCQNEVFRPSCGPNEVVVMTTASYGRQKLSRCLERDYGYVGCKQDVLRQSDSLCSGQHQCHVTVPNTKFDNASTCPKDLKSYLTASYMCLGVVTAPRQSCNYGIKVSIPVNSTTPGYLGSIVSEETQKGSHDCPWQLVAKPGQRINITLIDFTQPGTSSCTAYATLKEPSGMQQPQTICGGNTRERHVYLSTTETVEIRIYRSSQRSPKKFLLKYEVRGCPDPQLPKNARVRREGDIIEVVCFKKSWRLRCQDNEWRSENGEEVTCGGRTIAEKDPAASSSSSDEKGPIPFGLSIVIIVTIAIVLGIFILVFGLVILKRKRLRDDTSKAHFYFSSSKTGRTTQIPNLTPGSGKEQESMYQSSENEYEYIGDLPPHYSTAHGQSLPSRNLEPYQTRRHDAPNHCKQHPQGNPNRKLLRDQKGILRYVDFEPPAYFELDPEDSAVAQDSGMAANGTPMARANQSIHEFSPYGYDHLVDQSGNSNHKSV